LEGLVNVTVHSSQARQVIFTEGSSQEPGEKDLEESGEGTSQRLIKVFFIDFSEALGDVSVKTVGSVVDETEIRPLGVVDDGVESRTVPDDDLEAEGKSFLGFDLGGETLDVGLSGVSHFFSPSLDALIGEDVRILLVVGVDDISGVVSDAVPELETIISVVVAGEAIFSFSGETTSSQLTGETGVEEVVCLPQSGGNSDTVVGSDDEGLVSEGKEGINEGVSGKEVDTDGFFKMGLEEASEDVSLGELVVDGNADRFHSQMGETQMITEFVGVVVSTGDEHLDEGPEVLGSGLLLVDGGVFSSFELNGNNVELVGAVGEVFSVEQ